MLDDSTENTEIPKLKFPKYYRELIGENQHVEGQRWSTEWLLSEYVRCTDGLVGRMDGTIPLIQTDIYVRDKDGLRPEKRDLPPPAAVIYLDKSARPVAWMVRAFWPVLARTPNTPFTEGVIPPKPKSYFLNIDKKIWLMRMGIPEEKIEDPEELFDISKISKEHLTRLRALFSTARIDEDGLDAAWNFPTIFDGQHIMIVDEVPSTYKTLRITQMLLTLAIPEAVFSGSYWANPGFLALNRGIEVDNNIQRKTIWVPVWYHKDIASGRGIEDIDEQWPENSDKTGYPPSRYSRVGRFFLSTPPHFPKTYQAIIDKKAMRIREDINRAAQDLAVGRILYRPSGDRPTDEDKDFEALKDRIEAINRMSYTEWQKKRDSLKPSAAI